MKRASESPELCEHPRPDLSETERDIVADRMCAWIVDARLTDVIGAAAHEKLCRKQE